MEKISKKYTTVLYIFAYFFCYAFGIYLQLLGASPLDSHRGSAPGPRWGTSSGLALMNIHKGIHLKYNNVIDQYLMQQNRRLQFE